MFLPARITFLAQCIVVVIVLIVTSGATLADDLLSPEDFTKAFIAKAATVARDRTFTFAEPLKVIVDAKSGQASSFHFFLDNIYRAYRSEPDRLDEIFRNHITSTLGIITGDARNTREQILPVIRHKDFSFGIENGEKIDLAVEQFSQDMLVFYVFDQAETAAFARSDEIKALGIKPQELKAVSLDNLRRNMPDPLIDTSEGLTIIDGGGSYLTGLLLLDEYWTTSRFPHRGDPVVFVIGRELMLVTGSEEKAVIDALRENSKKLVEETPYPISDQPIFRRNGRWEAY